MPLVVRLADIPALAPVACDGEAKRISDTASECTASITGSITKRDRFTGCSVCQCDIEASEASEAAHCSGCSQRLCEGCARYCNECGEAVCDDAECAATCGTRCGAACGASAAHAGCGATVCNGCVWTRECEHAVELCGECDATYECRDCECCASESADTRAMLGRKCPRV